MLHAKSGFGVTVFPGLYQLSIADSAKNNARRAFHHRENVMIKSVIEHRSTHRTASFERLTAVQMNRSRHNVNVTSSMYFIECIRRAIYNCTAYELLGYARPERNGENTYVRSSSNMEIMHYRHGFRQADALVSQQQEEK